MGENGRDGDTSTPQVTVTVDAICVPAPVTREDSYLVAILHQLQTLNARLESIPQAPILPEGTTQIQEPAKPLARLGRRIRKAKGV